MFRLAGLLVFAGVMGATGVGGQTLLTVRALDSAAIPRAVLSSAQAESAYLLGLAGVQVEWLECIPEQSLGRGCEVPGPNDIILRILPHSTIQGAFGADILGRAIGVRYADLYDADITRTALDRNVPREQVYAMAMMHELGHLLLGPGAHTPAGLMRARWDAADFDAASKRRLRFTPRQCQVIRAAVALRGTQLAVP